MSYANFKLQIGANLPIRICRIVSVLTSELTNRNATDQISSCPCWRGFSSRGRVSCCCCCRCFFCCCVVYARRVGRCRFADGWSRESNRTAVGDHVFVRARCLLARIQILLLLLLVLLLLAVRCQSQPALISIRRLPMRPVAAAVRTRARSERWAGRYRR